MMVADPRSTEGEGLVQAQCKPNSRDFQDRFLMRLVARREVGAQRRGQPESWKQKSVCSMSAAHLTNHISKLARS